MEEFQAYQYYSTDAFNPYNRGITSIDSNYLDGVSLTHGSTGSRQHIWSFAAALFESSSSNYNLGNRIFNCPCTDTRHNWPYQIPPFVGNNYFCDSGNPGPQWTATYYKDNPLWDGEGCGPYSSCCQFNKPPWFQTTLPHTTSDNIELRLCNGESGASSEDVVLYIIDIFVS